MKFFQVSVFLLALCFSTSSVAIDYAKYKKHKARQQVSVLEQAKKAANDWAFDEAEQLLEQAQNMAYTPKKLKAIESLISKQRLAKSDKERREREAKAEKERQQQLARARQQTQDRQNSDSSSGGGSPVDYVMVSFDSVCGFALCINKNLQISGGPGRFSPSYSGAYLGAIYKGYNGGLAAGLFNANKTI